jgi:thioester reductase-like protein
MSWNGNVCGLRASEKVVMEAIDYLPGGAIFRPARISGCSTTGAGPKNDLFASILIGMRKFGYYPDMDFPFDLTPVDYCKYTDLRKSQTLDRFDV